MQCLIDYRYSTAHESSGAVDQTAPPLLDGQWIDISGPFRASRLVAQPISKKVFC